MKVNELNKADLTIILDLLEFASSGWYTNEVYNDKLFKSHKQQEKYVKLLIKKLKA